VDHHVPQRSVSAIARDLGRLLGCYGHVVSLRRIRVGPFRSDEAVTLDELRNGPAGSHAMQPVEAGLAELPRLAIDRDGAATLRRGQKLLLRGAHLPAEGPAYATCFGAPVAFGVIEAGYFVSSRVFNLPG
jgi:tRNA pseudouridine55 synthase